MFGFLKKLFPSKKEKDVQALYPIVAQVNAEYAKLHNLSDDELRGRTATFRARIKEHTANLSADMEAIRNEAEVETDIAKKQELYDELDKVRKEFNQAIEQVLNEIMPEAFAVVKETARRLTENKVLRVTATDFDRELASRRPDIVVIEGSTAVWDNKWMVITSEIEWNMVHYDVQIIGGAVLHQGKISEMATGEGKTLVATLPVYLNSLAEQGLHLVTVNNYLAQRDCEWNGPIFQFHQLSVDCIDLHEPNSEDRRRAYGANITYGTNNEFGFDYLRDNMTTHPEFLVQKLHHYAIIDEVDSVLIDEARTPLIISGPVPNRDKDTQQYYDLKPRIEKLLRKQKDTVNQFLQEAKRLIAAGDKENGGIALLRAHRGLPKNGALIKYLSETGIKQLLNKVEGVYLQDNSKRMPEIDEPLYFTIDEKNNQIEMTDNGRDLITQQGEDRDLFVIPDVGARFHEISLMSTPENEKLQLKEELVREYADKSELLHAINQLLKAYALFESNIDYIVQEGKVMIVDEQTGRVLAGRRYSDGLHQAIEAKENVKVEASTQTFATITLQNYFRMYHKLCGMTGTAETEEKEFFDIYKLDVVVIPTNRPIQRKDLDDMIYKTKRAKYNAIIQEVVQMRESGRPVLVGTTSVEDSELLSRMLKMQKIPHNVLNAKYHQKEAEIVAEAGQAGTITIATNMAGRGTDIKLGAGVKEAGGLAIIGTERHESRRIDRQLRGRAGRQGDSGSSQFYISLEDELMRLFSNVERVSKIMDYAGFKEDDVIQHPTITKQIGTAQQKVEENNFAMRKRLLEYDDVMNSQREVIYKRRRAALYGDRIKIDLDNMMEDLCTAVIERHIETADAEALQLDCIRTFAIDPEISERDLGNEDAATLSGILYDKVRTYYDAKCVRIAEMLNEGIRNMKEANPQIERIIVPFSDGHKSLQLIVNIEEVCDTNGTVITDELEKNIVLSVIDEKWKTHLREMDELRQAVQNAVYEQKDPLLVYKFEAFQIFDTLLKAINQEVLSMLFKAELHVEENQPQKIEEPKRDDFSKMKQQHQNPNEAADEALRKQREEERRQMLNGEDEPQEDRRISRRERRESDRKNRK
ncbi:MAG: preprotein translocase subunit SecA [Bacteroidia bacterium]